MNDKMQWFRDRKLGIFMHWGIYSVLGVTESWSFYSGEVDYDTYMEQCENFGAENYDPERWAELFCKVGARYTVLTAKHHDGVALWDTKASNLNVVHKTPAGRDLIGPYCDAMRKRGIKVGLYFSSDLGNSFPLKNQHLQAISFFLFLNFFHVFIHFFAYFSK